MTACPKLDLGANGYDLPFAINLTKMKRLRNIVFILLGIILLALFIGYRYLNSGSLEPDNSVWEAYIGRDTSVGILPDEYANYFTYTLVRTNKNVGFRIKGEFPSTRYMSFNVYSLHDNATQGSIVDYKIATDSGKPNPFLVSKDSADVGTNYTVHILPEKYVDEGLSNTLPFDNDVRFLLMVIRLYDYNIDDFGGVEYPTVEAFTLDNSNETAEINPVRLPRALSLRSIVRRVSLPKMVKRLGVVFETENTVQTTIESSDRQYYTVPFHAINDDGFIENNDNRYLLSAITKQEDEVYVFRFKPPSYTTGPENINQTDVRYWSFNLGNRATYNFNAIKDEDALLDEMGYVNIVLAHQDTELEKRAEQLGFNFLEWNMPWKEGFILFRHMLTNPDFEAQIDDVPVIDENTTDFKKTEAQNFIGDYAPQGIRMSKADFLKEYDFDENYIEVEQD